VDRLTVDVRSCDARLSSCSALVTTEYGPGSFYRRPSSPLSVVDLAGDWNASRAARWNASRCERLGMSFRPEISRDEWAHDLNDLRSSARERQGREMPASYLEAQDWPRDELPACPRHGDYFHGVVSGGGKLVAYLHVVQCGDSARFNTILGHADYLADGAVWLLTLRALEYHRDECDARHGIYYTHDSGHGGGLRYFKERFRFRPAVVSWR
jgi:hypothetical protein